jgi:exopolysaccharide biosynthesis polyprenyl glycosylphosphotransferase
VLNVSVESPVATVDELGIPSWLDVQSPAEAIHPRERRAKVAGSFARAALRWPVGVWGTLDALAAFGSFVLAHHLSPRFEFSQWHGYQIGMAAAVFAGVLVCLSYAQGLYDRHSLASYGLIIRAAVLANLLALAATSLGFGWFRLVHFGRVVLLCTLLTSAGAIILVRLIARALARSAKVRLLFVGNRRKFRPLERELRLRYREFYHRPAYVELTGGPSATREKQLLQAVRRSDPDEIVVEDDDRIIPELLSQSSQILGSGCEIRSHAAYFEEMLGQVPVEVIDHRAMLGNGLKNSRYGTNLTKRLMDVCLAGFGLVVGAPVMLLLAVLVRWFSGQGPIIYKQTRVGRYGRQFSIYKFRTMRSDAERNGAVWAKGKDARVTPIGRLLRKSRLDELPQLWNILKGEMSFVGPRPERPEFVGELRKHIPHYDLRHLVPPGLTGWAQVRYRYGASIQDAQRKLAFDLFYVRRYSPSFDLLICLRTVVVMAKGAR